MLKFKVTGMSCAACSARVERAVCAIPGAKDVSVNLLTGDLRVSGVTAEAVTDAVTKAGYGVAAKTEGRAKASPRPAVIRFLLSLVLLVPLMWLGMSMQLPSVQLLLSGAVIALHFRFFTSGVRAALHLSPSMDTLVALGSGVSFLYSAYVWLFVGEGAHLYFDSAAMILVLITLGKMLEARAKGKSTDAIRALLALSPEEATLLRDGEAVRVPVSTLKVGDLILLRPGDRVPVDGVIVSGEGAFDESALTGESLPADKRAGEHVFTATLNLSGAVTIRAEGVGEDTALGRIVAAVTEASTTKAPVAKLADRVAGVFVPVVICISLLTFGLHLLLNSPPSAAVGYAISVLVISCPCALGLATPVAIMVGSGKGARYGILYKNAAVLEVAGRVKTVLLDKTGTVTEGKMQVTDVLPAEGVSKEELLSLAMAIEEGSEHPLARAIVEHCRSASVVPASVTGFESHAGAGVSALYKDAPLLGGKLAFAGTPSDDVTAARLGREGKTSVFFRHGERPLGVIALSDSIKADSAAAIAALRGMGIRTLLLTGDRRDTAEAVAARLSLDGVIAEVLPEEKAAAVRRYRADGAVMMVGDGVNDAVALTAADVGVAIGAGTDIAIDAADIVLSRADLTALADAVALSRKTLRNIKQNLFWAFFYNALAIPLAAGAFSALGFTLSPMIGAAAMSVSSLFVVTNALRLGRVKLPSDHKENKGETKEMQTTLNIKGMMCPHCSGRVREALLAITGVSAADVSHERGNAIITHGADVTREALVAAVTGAGYDVVD